jgi:hypothetical protein
LTATEPNQFPFFFVHIGRWFVVEKSVKKYVVCEPSSYLIVRAQGKKEWLQDFASKVKGLYPNNNISFTPLIRHSEGRFYIYIHILMEAE